MFEKKNGKRFLSSVMALVMLLSLAPVGALAAGDEPPTNEECSAVALPANEDNPKPVVTDEENTENTNEELIPPPRNEGDTGTPADNNDTSTAISEAVILLEGDLFDQPFGVNPPESSEPSTQYERLYVTILNGTEFPNEPGFSHKYGYDFVKRNDDGGYSIEAYNQASYSSNQQVFSTQAGNFIKVNAFDAAGLTTNGNVKGLYNANGIDLTEYTTFTESDANAIAAAYASYKNLDASATYKLVPYVLKYEDHGKGSDAPSTGYHLDYIVVKNETVLVKYDVNGATTDFQLPDNTYVVPGSDVTIGSWKNSSGTVANNITAKKDGKDVTFVGWSTNPNADADSQGLYQAGNSLQNIKAETTLYAIWKKKEEEQPTPSTDTVDAKYFVLMPSANAPSSGRSQGWENYFPSERTENGKKITDDGGVEGASRATGYAGKITQVAADLVKNEGDGGYFKATGVEDAYLAQKPTNLGYFDRQNYNQTVSPWTYTGHGSLPATLSGFTMEGKEVVWYVIKNAGTTTTPDYHVDGYVKGVDIEVKYHQNFAEGTSWTQTGLESGDTVEIKNYTEVWQDSSHEGYTFTGWNTKANGTGDSYVANTDAVLKTSMDLYAQWEKDVWTDADAKDNPSAEDKDSKDKGDGIPDSQQILIEYKAYKEGNGTVEPGFEVITVKKDGTLTPTKGSTANAETGYVFVTWSDKNAVVNETTVDSIVSSAAATTKTAKWTPNLTASDKGKTYTYTAIFLEDKVGDKNEDGTDKGDGIPDAWQHKVTFKVVNGKWNDDSSDNIVVYVNAKDKDGKTLESKLTEAQIPAVGEKPNSGYRASGSWDKSLSAGLKITGDTEFTFTYSRRSSGGSSRPSTPPTVDIPDDVPTGLNGKDHYAYIIGYGNNDVRPQNNITRAEVATIFFRLLTDETRTANMTKSNSYNDVKDGDWFCCAVSTLSKMGIIKGYEDGSFKPNDPISRAEFAAIAARFDPDGDKTPATFADVTSHWAKDEISIAANHGWIKGYEDGSFKPDQKITRAETMTLVNRVLNRLPETKDDLHKDMKTWVDNMDETAWYYLAVQEATNSHYFKNKTGTKFEQWTELRDTRDWSELEK